jgi:hypothetical protein
LATNVLVGSDTQGNESKHGKIEYERKSKRETGIGSGSHTGEKGNQTNLACPGYSHFKLFFFSFAIRATRFFFYILGPELACFLF